MEHKDLDLTIFNCNQCSEALKYRAYPMPGFYGSNCYNNISVIAQNPGIPNSFQKSKKYKFEDIEDDYFNSVLISPLGKFLNEILSVDIQDIFYSNVVKCAFPPGYNLEYEIPKCQGYLYQQLKIVNPRLIITIGLVALNFFISGLSIQKKSLQKIKWNNIYIIPSYHPSFINKWLEKDKIEYITKLASLIQSSL